MHRTETGRICWPTLGCAVAYILMTTLSLCAQTNHYWRNIEVDPLRCDPPYRVSLFSPQHGEDARRLRSQTGSIFIYGLGVVGVLVAMPEEMTGWNPEADIFSKWWDNVTEGPEWDRNNWIYNYVGHTYSGGVYYQVARKSGYRQWDAFVYTFLMSTFYWEYGVEAFAEVPSIQDLAVTPLMGWVYGEWAYRTEIGIRSNNGRVMGSRLLGGTALALLDPVDTLGRGVNRIVGRQWIRAGCGYLTYEAEPVGADTARIFYLNVKMPIGGPAGPSAEQPRYTLEPDDPVDTGIVGISIGPGRTLLDASRNMTDVWYYRVTLGLYFTPALSGRLSYARGEAEDRLTAAIATYENYSLDAQYYLFSRCRFRPYLTGGFGEQMWEESPERKSFQWNAGIGIHCRLHRKWALQFDWINRYSPGAETYDRNFNAGLLYRFGRGEQDAW